MEAWLVGAFRDEDRLTLEVNSRWDRWLALVNCSPQP